MKHLPNLHRPKSLYLRSKQLGVGLELVVILALVVTGFTFFMPTHQTAEPTSSNTKASTESQYQKTLQSKVDNKDGSPLSGRDPAAQPQTSLVHAASVPSGTGRRTTKPAADITGSTTANKTKPSQQYGHNAPGVNDAGCFYDYGIPGQQCLQVSLAGKDGKLTCKEVRQHYPNGIKVYRTDRFNLDTNHNGIACDPKDKS